MDRLPLELLIEIADLTGVVQFIRTISSVSKVYNALVNSTNVDFYKRLCTSRSRSLSVSPFMKLVVLLEHHDSTGIRF